MDGMNQAARQQSLCQATTQLMLAELDDDLRQGWDQLDWQASVMLSELVGLQTIRLLRQLLEALQPKSDQGHVELLRSKLQATFPPHGRTPPPCAPPPEKPKG